MDRQPPNPSAASNRNVWFMAAAVGVMLALHALPTPPPLERSGEVVELTSGGKATIAILAFAVVLWITEAIPFRCNRHESVNLDEHAAKTLLQDEGVAIPRGGIARSTVTTRTSVAPSEAKQTVELDHEDAVLERGRAWPHRCALVGIDDEEFAARTVLPSEAQIRAQRFGA